MKHIWVFALISLSNYNFCSGIKYAVLENPETKTEDTVDYELSEFSGWELFALNDLQFQITMKQCPRINRPAASFLKTYITKAVKNGPRNENQNENFLSAYTGLMECFDYLDAKSRNPGKKLEDTSGNLLDFVESSDQVDKKADSSADYSKTGDGWMLKLQGLSYALTEISRWGRDLAERLLWLEKKPKTTKNDEESEKQFKEFLRNVNRVVQANCPAELGPTDILSNGLTQQLLHWVSKDSELLKKVAIKYFQNNSINEEIEKCLTM